MIKKALELMKTDLKKFWKHLLIAFIVVAVLEVLFDEVCFTKILFNLPCPACGMTRALILFFTGHPVRAFFMNPLYGYVIVIILLFIWTRYIANKPFKSFFFHLIVFVILLTISFFIKLIFFPHLFVAI